MASFVVNYKLQPSIQDLLKENEILKEKLEEIEYLKTLIRQQKKVIDELKVSKNRNLSYILQNRQLSVANKIIDQFKSDILNIQFTLNNCVQQCLTNLADGKIDASAFDDKIHVKQLEAEVEFQNLYCQSDCSNGELKQENKYRLEEIIKDEKNIKSAANYDEIAKLKSDLATKDDELNKLKKELEYEKKKTDNCAKALENERKRAFDLEGELDMKRDLLDRNERRCYGTLDYENRSNGKVLDTKNYERGSLISLTSELNAFWKRMKKSSFFPASLQTDAASACSNIHQRRLPVRVVPEIPKEKEKGETSKSDILLAALRRHCEKQKTMYTSETGRTASTDDLI